MNRRLQEVKRKVMTFNQELREIDLEEHVDWLVEQAERVQELESDSYNAYLERLLDRKEQEIERYREALTYYAEKSNYDYDVRVDSISYVGDQSEMNFYRLDSEILYDKGEKARKALEGRE